MTLSDKKSKLNNKEFIFILQKSPARQSGLLLLCCPSGYGLHSQTHLMVQYGQCNSSYHIHIPVIREEKTEGPNISYKDTSQKLPLPQPFTPYGPNLESWPNLVAKEAG